MPLSPHGPCLHETVAWAIGRCAALQAADAQPISASRDQYQARTEHQGAARSVAKRGRREGDALQGVKVTRTESRVPGTE